MSAWTHGSSNPARLRPAAAGSPTRIGIGPLDTGRGGLVGVLQPGPLRAFYQRVRTRRGHGKAIVATARKLAILFWCMLTRGESSRM
jgi:hypothetical protein